MQILFVYKTRVLREELPIELTEIDDYTFILIQLKRKGYAGVGVYSKENLSKLILN